jgi:hypothetical protein
MNPINMLKGMMGNMNPRNIAMQLLGQNNNPIFNNLIDMANKGDTKGIEEFARNYMKEQGKDFDKEFNNFKGMFK